MTHAALVAGGVLVLLLGWLGAPALLLPPFSAHMTVHMGVVAVAAPLVALGFAGTRLDPALRWPRLMSIVPASLAELILVWGWHTPALHHAARQSTLAFLLEQASFLASGLWLWSSAVGGAPRDLQRRSAGIVGLLLTSMHMTLLGALLALPPRVLYDHRVPESHHDSDGPPSVASGAAPSVASGAAPSVASGAAPSVASGDVRAHHHAPSRTRAVALPGSERIGALADQHLGGAIMIVLGGASYLAGAAWLSVGLVRRRGSLDEPLSLPTRALPVTRRKA